MNPTQLLEHRFFPGQNHGEKRARWHNGKAACNPQLLVGIDRTQLPPSFSAHLPAAQSVSLTPQRSQMCWRSFSDGKNQRKAAPERCLSIRQASAGVGAHLCCFPAEQEAPHRLSWSLPFQKSTCKTSSTWVVE